MATVIDAIYAKNKTVNDYLYGDYENKLIMLSGFSKINMFVGANNSGKSRLMRCMFIGQIGRDDHFRYLKINDTKVNQIYIEMRRIFDPEYKNKNYRNEDKNFFESLFELENNQNNFIKYLIDNYIPYKNENIRKNIERKIKVNNIYDEYLLNNKYLKDIDPINFVYIPILRGVEPLYFLNTTIKEKLISINDFGDNARSYINALLRINTESIPSSLFSSFDVYYTRTCNNYFRNNIREYKNYLGENNHHVVFTGLEIYKDLEEKLLGSIQNRELIREYEIFLSENFFDKKEITLIPMKKYDTVYVKIDNEEYAIYELGDGIQSIIILTYPIFINKEKNSIFFIEEPEIHLHPGLQRRFIQFLINSDFNHQYFISTHSNHLLDLSFDFNDISIYQFQKVYLEDKNGFIIKNTTPGDLELLSELDVKDSSIFTSNCTIWVEGITDRMYIREYLNIMQKSMKKDFKEDINFSFIEYAGNNITHWSFLEDEDDNCPNINYQRIKRNIFLITDRDKGKKERHEKLRERLGDSYYCLESIEIENILHESVIKEVIRQYENNAGAEYETIMDIPFKCIFTWKGYNNQPLGTFIDKQFVEKSKRETYAENSGTIKDKLNFAKKACAFMRQHKGKPNEILSTEAIELTNKILNFIESCNK